MFRNFLGIIVAALIFTSCGGDSSSSPSNSYSWVSSLSELGSCDKKHEGVIVYASKEDVYVTCHDGFWGEFSEETIGDNSSSSAKSSSSQKSNSGDDGYFDLQGESSSSKAQIELNLKVAADDTILSLRYLNDCNSSHVGKYIYLISLSLYMICTEDGWKEYDPPSSGPDKGSVVDPKTSTGTSDLTNYFEEYDISQKQTAPNKVISSYKDITYASVLFGECDAQKDNQIFKDTLRAINSDISPDHLFYCKNGVWLGVTSFFADTLQLETAPYGTFKEGFYAGRGEKSLSNYCQEDFISTDHQVYVMDNGWREATTTEICFKEICSKKNEGEFYDFDGYQFLCHNRDWSIPLIFEMPNQDFFNKDYAYETMEDERDGRIYKTTQIGSQLWMAENLNYSGVSGEFGTCYKDNLQYCETSGRFYSWNEFMNALDSLPPSTSQGICPDGWAIPDKADYTQLIDYTKFKCGYTGGVCYGSTLFAKGAWEFSWDYFAFGDQVDLYGFSAIGGMLYKSGGYSKNYTNFCIASKSSDILNYASIHITREEVGGLHVDKAIYNTLCNVRCIKKDATSYVEDAE